ncbi:MAG: chemotaxis protein CheW [Bacillota bacterium]|nr:chemotaxis protein CheW [Bacillota bacterium]MDD3297318.1 chemotaxis protein CheW [Bacillota bacterium]MDD3850111.1 chemotaxis protein CheW [Bacillota bacterium]MDD4706834.1 chemotaxis protein CheW [Bacillota bacterium]
MPVNQYVVFEIEDREFAVDIERVKTIEKVTEITRVPGTQDFVMGVINLRGDVIPVIDTRKRMDLGDRDFDSESRIIIMNVDDMEAGITADSATEVIGIERDLIDSNLDFSGDRDDGFIKGVARLQERIIVILDLEKLLRLA